MKTMRKESRAYELMNMDKVELKDEIIDEKFNIGMEEDNLEDFGD